MNDRNFDAKIQRSYTSPEFGNASYSAHSDDHAKTAHVTQPELFRSLTLKNSPTRTHSENTKRNDFQTCEMKPNLVRTFRDVPYEIRERVVEVVTRAEQLADDAKKNQLKLNKELLNLRREYYKTDKEVCAKVRKRDLLLNQINIYNEKMGALEDDAESRRLRASKNAEAISRLSRTNKRLVEAFSKLYDDGTAVQVGRNKSEGLANPQRKALTRQHTRRGHIGISTEDPPTSPTQPKDEEPVIATSNEKLRERLLQVAKEHNRVVKNVEVLEIKVEGLRSSVRFAEKRNIQLKNELDELRESASLDGSTTVQLDEAKQATSSNKDEASKKPKTQRTANVSRFKSLLENTTFDAMDGIRHLDALLQHVVAAPATLSEKELAAHLCNRLV